MTSPSVRIYFDFVDPLSYVASVVLTPAADAAGVDIEWVGVELAPPPTPLTDRGDPAWRARLEAAAARAEGLDLRMEPPTLVPWSRKAHELHLLAAGHGKAEAIRSALFEAFFVEGRDIGRVDVLVEIAASAGLDRTETKAVLDVDRHEADVAAARREALQAGLTEVPSHSSGGRIVQGFPDPTDLGTLLPDG